MFNPLVTVEDYRAALALNREYQKRIGTQDKVTKKDEAVLSWLSKSEQDYRLKLDGFLATLDAEEYEKAAKSAELHLEGRDSAIYGEEE